MMNEHNPLQDQELALTDELVVTYLQDHPELFTRHPEVFSSLRLIDNQRGTVSLVERQQKILREKVHSLEEEITQLMSIANHNEQLFGLYSDMYLRLLDCGSASELLDSLYQTITELLSLSEVKLWLVTPSDFSHSRLINEDCSEIFANRLSRDEYYFGRLQQSEQTLLFNENTVGSVILIKLSHEENDLGFLAISSADAEHFDPRMDTLLLSQFRKLVAKLLQQKLTD